MNKKVTLRRYTDLPALLYMLRRRKISLLNPSNWDDRNDAYYLELYRERKNLGAVLTLCFTEVGETYHHWKVFSPGTGGICIRFDKGRLIEYMLEINGVRAGPAQYKMMDHIRQDTPSLEDLPLLKRYAFRHEHEFRLIYESTRPMNVRDFSFPIECIDRITINPWVNEKLADAIWEIVRGLGGCEDLIVGQSSLINNNEWKMIGTKAT
ncbi:MAG: DUF2971 domain-containing protein [Candidatus Thiodiazotropha sp. (ex Epidulcina cf. delphinae)]|nr:DUF2971 domain-containing protein [Candidatus Thiodiazotropha sp. (ex Epidulcina cf. delphinae)]